MSKTSIIRIREILKYKNIVIPSLASRLDGYHKSCYQKFNALSSSQRKKAKEIDDLEASMLLQQPVEAVSEDKTTANTVVDCETRSLRSQSHVKTSRTGIFPNKCIYCGLQKKKVQGNKHTLISCTTTSVQEQIKRTARWRKDHRLLAIVGDVNFISKEVKYHNVCRLQYERVAKLTPAGIAARKMEGEKDPEQSSKTEWQTMRKAHATAFAGLKFCIEESIIKKKEVYSLCGLNKPYRSILQEIVGHDDLLPTSQKHQQEICKTFRCKIRIVTGSTNLVCTSEIGADKDRRIYASNVRCSQRSMIKDVAYLLRKSTISSKKSPLPDAISTAALKKGECSTPELLRTFYKHLIVGPDEQRADSESKAC